MEKLKKKKKYKWDKVKNTYQIYTKINDLTCAWLVEEWKTEEKAKTALEKRYNNPDKSVEYMLVKVLKVGKYTRVEPLKDFAIFYIQWHRLFNRRDLIYNGVVEGYDRDDIKKKTQMGSLMRCFLLENGKLKDKASFQKLAKENGYRFTDESKLPLKERTCNWMKDVKFKNVPLKRILKSMVEK